MAEITIKGVEGNPLNINVVMNEILHHLSDGVMETETVDFYPDTTKPVRAYLDSVTARRQYCPSVAVSGNTVYLSANNVTAGVYTLTIICTDTNGKTRRFKSDACIEIYDITRAAEVAEEFDSEQYTINGVFYTFMTQSDWDEVNPASPAYILNKPDLTEYATKEDIETIEGEIPVIPEWAQQPQKPTYTAGEVGAVPTSRTVNGKALSEDITLNAQDVGAQTPIADLAQIREGAAKGATAYQKPSNGMPKTDLAVSVQQSLDKADTAYQKPSAGIPKTDFAQEIQDRLNIPIDEIPTAGSNNLVKSGGVQNELALGAVYDVSVKNPTAGPNNDGKWESLSALLSDANLNTLIPTSVRKGGMSIKFVQSSDNNYVQARLMADAFTTDVTKWQVVDAEPTVNSKNLVESGGVAMYFAQNSSSNYSPEYTNNAYIGLDGVQGTANGYGVTVPILLKSKETITLNMGNLMYLGAETSVLSEVQENGDWISCLKQRGSQAYELVTYTNTSGSDMYVKICGYKSQLRYIISSLLPAASKEGAIVGWINAEAYTVINATYTSGVINSPVNVALPDGATGSLTITRVNGLVTKIVAVHDEDSYDYTITRDGYGNVTNTTIVKK